MLALQEEEYKLIGLKVLKKGNLGPRIWTEAMSKWKSSEGRKFPKRNDRVMMPLHLLDRPDFLNSVTWLFKTKLSKLA